MVKKIVGGLAVAILTGCAGSPARVGMMSAQELQQQNPSVLCNAYFQSHAAKIRAELQRRELFSREEWEAIDQHIVLIGHSVLEAECAWGGASDINRTVTAQAVHMQMVYCESVTDCLHPRFVYTDGARITAIQD